MAWRQIAEDLARVARTAGCRCDYERTRAGVPVWYLAPNGGIERKLLKRCSRCAAIALYESMVAA